MLLNITSILGNMIIRYQLEETIEIYNFILSSASKKYCRICFRLFDTIKNFEYYPNKWLYFMSM